MGSLACFRPLVLLFGFILIICTHFAASDDINPSLSPRGSVATSKTSPEIFNSGSGQRGYDDSEPFSVFSPPFHNSYSPFNDDPASNSTDLYSPSNSTSTSSHPVNIAYLAPADGVTNPFNMTISNANATVVTIDPPTPEPSTVLSNMVSSSSSSLPTHGPNEGLPGSSTAFSFHNPEVNASAAGSPSASAPPPKSSLAVAGMGVGGLALFGAGIFEYGRRALHRDAVPSGMEPVSTTDYDTESGSRQGGDQIPRPPAEHSAVEIGRSSSFELDDDDDDEDDEGGALE